MAESLYCRRSLLIRSSMWFSWPCVKSPELLCSLGWKIAMEKIASTYFVLAQKISLWKNILCDLCKKDKNMSRTKAFCSNPDLSFLYRSQKMSFHRGFFCANMKYVEVCPDLFLEFFDIWKMVFWAVGAAAPMTRNGFPVVPFAFHNSYLSTHKPCVFWSCVWIFEIQVTRILVYRFLLAWSTSSNTIY